jgi:type I restriction enzyme S subunit
MKLDLSTFPEDWIKTKLRNVAILKSGSTPDRARFNDYFHKGTISWVKTLDLNNGIIRKTEEKITEKALKETSCSMIPKDTVLVAMYGGFNQIGRTGLLSFNAAINQAITAITVNQKIEPAYLLHWLNNYIGLWKRFAASSRKDPNITKNDVSGFPFAYPSKSEQTKIVEVLFIWDKAIETTEKLLIAKQTRKRGLMQRLLTGRKRLPQFMSQAWVKVGAGEVFKNISIKSNENEELLSATQNKGIIPRSMLEARVTMPSGDTNSFKLVEAGDFVISLRSFQGGLEYSYYRGLVSPAYTVLKPIKKINDEFYKFYFKSYDFIEHLATAVIGIRDGKQISYGDFCLVKIPFPNYEEQTAIAKVLQTADKEIELLKKQLKAFKRQKRGLMQKLLTGKIRVKVDAVEAMEAQI